MCVCNKAKACVLVTRPNFRPINFDTNDEGSMFFPKNWRPPAILRRVTKQNRTI
jgi:hypothetical protein